MIMKTSLSSSRSYILQPIFAATGEYTNLRVRRMKLAKVTISKKSLHNEQTLTSYRRTGTIIHPMMHIPSFLVGSAATGAGFLFIHKQLSHRSRISAKWALMERAERHLHDLMADARSSSFVDDATTNTSYQSFAVISSHIKKYWNGRVTSAKDFLQTYAFGDDGAGGDSKSSKQ